MILKVDLMTLKIITNNNFTFCINRQYYLADKRRRGPRVAAADSGTWRGVVARRSAPPPRTRRRRTRARTVLAGNVRCRRTQSPLDSLHLVRENAF